MDELLFLAFVFLCAGVVAVPIASRLGLGGMCEARKYKKKVSMGTGVPHKSHERVQHTCSTLAHDSR